MIPVTCAVCGYKGEVYPHYNFFNGKSKGKSPDIWICDLHQKEFMRDAWMKQLEAEANVA